MSFSMVVKIINGKKLRNMKQFEHYSCCVNQTNFDIFSITILSQYNYIYVDVLMLPHKSLSNTLTLYKNNFFSHRNIRIQSPYRVSKVDAMKVQAWSWLSLEPRLVDFLLKLMPVKHFHKILVLIHKNIINVSVNIIHHNSTLNFWLQKS